MERSVSDRLNETLRGRYRVVREIGEGGTATVFLAEDLRHERSVVLKVLRPELAAAVGTRRFLTEIRTTARLRHPHILPLFDSGEADGLLFQVIPFVEGGSLRRRLDVEEQLSIDDAVRIAAEVGGALAYAHEAGVIHRDVKPENILLEDGHAVVCDFGIAKALSEASSARMTHTGLAIGTPAYMSPEQATATVRLEARSDIYSLGCVLYEMLAGGPPYSGPTPHSILARKISEPVPGLRVVRDTVPSAVEAVVVRALAKVPADRFPTAREFVQALTGDGERAEAPPRARGGSERRPPSAIGARPRRWVPGVAVGAGGAAVLALGLYVATTARAPRPLRATFRQLTTQSGVEDAPSLSPDGEWIAYAGEGPEGRDVFLQGVGGRLPIDLTEDAPEDDFDPAFSPDGSRIAFRSSREGGGLFVMGRTGEAVRRLTSAGFDPKWSPDGAHLVYATEGVGLLPENWLTISQLWVVDVDDGTETRLFEGDAVQPSWSPHGTRIAFTARMAETSNMDIWTIPASGGAPVPLTSDAPTDWGATWSADGRWVYFSSERGGSTNLWRIAVDETTGRAAGEPEPLTTPSPFAAHPSISASGSLVAYSTALTVQNVERASLDWRAGVLEEREWITTGSRPWSSPDPAADGHAAVFYSRDLPEGDLYIARLDGGPPRQVTSGDAVVDRMPRWSPDGAWIAYFSTASGPLSAWVVRPDGSGARQATDAGGASFGAWSPDGARLAVNGSADPSWNPVVVFDPRLPWSGQRPDTLPPAPDSIGVFQVNDWSPDGARLAGMIAPLSEEGVVLYSFATSTYERLTDFGQWPVWLPDARHLLFVTGGRAFWIIDAETREARRIYASNTDVLGPPRVTRDGRTIVYTRRSTEGDVWLATLEGRRRVCLSRLPGP